MTNSDDFATLIAVKVFDLIVGTKEGRRVKIPRGPAAVTVCQVAFATGLMTGKADEPE